jgi:AcrR family transcriptional regulator
MSCGGDVGMIGSMPSRSSVRAPSGTRAERQEITRARLLEAAGRLIARNGFNGTSIDDIAASAGYTKGAFYSNFASKEELLVALFDDRAARRMTELLALLADVDEPADRLAVIDGWLLGKSRRNRDLILLELELALAAVRQAPLRRMLAERYAATRAQVAALLADSLAGTDTDTAPLPVAALASVIVAVTDGLPLQGLVDPDAVPETAFSDAVARMLGLAGPVAASTRRALDDSEDPEDPEDPT